MSDVNDHCSDTSSDLNWPLDHSIERQQDERVVFENVADQYVKGADVTAFFTILSDIKVKPDEDRIGLLRIGCTSMKECIAYAPVQFNPSTTSGAICHGIATFPSSSLPVTDDEFYQFCYIKDEKKNFGSSIPFQLNCELDDIDLLSNKPTRKVKADGLIALADHENDDLVVIHTKRLLTEEKLRQENRQLLETNRRLELEKDEYQAKLDLSELKAKEHTNKLIDEMQTLSESYKAVLDELSARNQAESKLGSQYDECRSLCDQYQAESLKNAQHCRILENSHKQILNDTEKIRSQLSSTSQLTKEQATQIVNLEQRLAESNELAKKSDQKQALLVQELNNLRIASENNLTDLKTQLTSYSTQIAEQDEQINTIEKSNKALEEEVTLLKVTNDSLSLMVQQEKELSQELQKELKRLSEEHQLESELKQNEIESLKSQLSDIKSSEQNCLSLKASMKEIENRCVKHQKNEIEVKRQLNVYKNFVNDLQRENQELTQRLSDGAEEYKVLYRKYTLLERQIEMNNQLETTNKTDSVDAPVFNDDLLESILGNGCESPREPNNEERETISKPPSSADNTTKEVDVCPMCYWEFPQHMSLAEKQEHVDHHFA